MSNNKDNNNYNNMIKYAYVFIVDRIKPNIYLVYK